MTAFLEIFRPDEYVVGITDIDLARLAADGYNCLLLDLDNTLLPWKSSEVADHVKQWVNQAKALGFRLSIVSNTHNPKRLRKIAEEMDITWTAQAIKPRRKGFLEAVKSLGCESSKAVVVGDQLLTDILGGNRAGIRTILVRPIDYREFVGTKLSRAVEWVIMLALGVRVGEGTNCEAIQSHTKEMK